MHEFADRERSRHDRRTWMQRGIRMRIVEIERMAERAVEQSSDGRRPGSVIAKDGRVTLPIQRQRLECLEQRGRGLRIAPRPDGAAEKIERQGLGALTDLFGDVFETKAGDIGGKRCGFVCHSCFLGFFWRDDLRVKSAGYPEPKAPVPVVQCRHRIAAERKRGYCDDGASRTCPSMDLVMTRWNGMIAVR